MADPQQRYVMAVKRGQEGLVPADWVSLLSAIPGVSVSQAGARSAQFQAAEESAEQVRRRFAELFHVEKVNERRILSE